MRFSVGQQVVCVGSGSWISSLTLEFNKGPKRNEIVTVEGYESEGYCYFYEYNTLAADGTREGYDERCFEPLSDISELEEILNQETITV